MKRKSVSIFLCLALVLCSVCAFAAVNFSNRTLTFTNTSTFNYVTSDTASVANPSRARLYITSNTSNVNSVFRAGKTSTGSAVTRLYYDRVTTGRMMYYNSDASIAAGERIYLQGRPDSSLSSCTITGSFGAG